MRIIYFILNKKVAFTKKGLVRLNVTNVLTVDNSCNQISDAFISFVSKHCCKPIPRLFGP